MSLSAAEAGESSLRETTAPPQADANASAARPVHGFVPPELLGPAVPKLAQPHEPLRRLPMPRQAESRLARFSWTAIAVGIATLYLFVLLSYWSPAHPGVDQNGYLVGGRQFAETFSTGMALQTPYDFIGRMWVTAPSGVNYPKYPLGLPILYACCIWLGSVTGWNGYEVAHLISPVSAMLATLGIFAIVRRLTLSGFAGVMAMVLLGTGQVFLTLADNPNSHASGTCTIVWGFYFLMRFLETGTLWRGIAAGFLLGFAYLIRYTDGMLVVLLGVAMLYMARWRRPNLGVLAVGGGAILVASLIAFAVSKLFGRSLAETWPMLVPLREAEGLNRPALFLFGTMAIAAFASLFMSLRSWWRLFVVGCAWLLPVVYQTVFNMVAMQSFTSYAGTNESTGFSGRDFVRNWELMVRTLHDQALFFIAPIGLLGLIAMFRRMPLIASLLALWFFPSILLYTAYYWAPDNWGVSYSRFILTAVPALTIAACWLMAEVVRQHGRSTWRLSPTAKSIASAVGIVVGGGLLAVAWFKFGDIAKDEWIWATAILGASFVVAGLVPLVARYATRDENACAAHFKGWVPRVAFGTIVFVAAGVSVARTTMGSEWGRLGNPRASIENQARQNANLWGLGQRVRAAVPDGSVLFADGDRMHHFQFIGDWRMYYTEYFDRERMLQQLDRNPGGQDGDADPIDPSRVKYLNTIYRPKDQATIRREMNDLIADALEKKTRVFYALTAGGAENFRRTLDRRRFDTKTVASYNDAPPPRAEEDFLPPSQRQPVMNRFGGARQRQANNFFAASEKQAWRIVEVTLNPNPAPATKPAPTTKTATTKSSATKPTTKPK